MAVFAVLCRADCEDIVGRGRGYSPLPDATQIYVCVLL